MGQLHVESEMVGTGILPIQDSSAFIKLAPHRAVQSILSQRINLRLGQTILSGERTRMSLRAVSQNKAPFFRLKSLKN